MPLLLEKVADKRALPRGLAEPLLTAVDQDNVTAVQQLLDMGAVDPAVGSHSGLGAEALIMAAKFERVGPAKCLLKGGVCANARGEGGRTALMAAAPRWSQEMMDVLLRAGADVNAGDDEGKALSATPCAGIAARPSRCSWGAARMWMVGTGACRQCLR